MICAFERERTHLRPKSPLAPARIFGSFAPTFLPPERDSPGSHGLRRRAPDSQPRARIARLRPQMRLPASLGRSCRCPQSGRAERGSTLQIPSQLATHSLGGLLGALRRPWITRNAGTRLISLRRTMMEFGSFCKKNHSEASEPRGPKGRSCMSGRNTPVGTLKSRLLSCTLMITANAAQNLTR